MGMLSPRPTANGSSSVSCVWTKAVLARAEAPASGLAIAREISAGHRRAPRGARSSRRSFRDAAATRPQLTKRRVAALKRRKRVPPLDVYWSLTPSQSDRRGLTATQSSKLARRCLHRSAARRRLRGAPWCAKIRRRLRLRSLLAGADAGRVRRGRPRMLCGACEPVGQHGGGGLLREPWIGASEPERQTFDISLLSPRRTSLSGREEVGRWK